MFWEEDCFLFDYLIQTLYKKIKSLKLLWKIKAPSSNTTGIFTISQNLVSTKYIFNLVDQLLMLMQQITMHLSRAMAEMESDEMTTKMVCRGDCRWQSVGVFPQCQRWYTTSTWKNVFVDDKGKLNQKCEKSEWGPWKNLIKLFWWIDQLPTSACNSEVAKGKTLEKNSEKCYIIYSFETDGQWWFLMTVDDSWWLIIYSLK